MANEYSANLKLRMEIVEVLDSALAVQSASRDNRTLKHLLDVDKTLNAGIAPPVAKVAVFQHSITAGSPDTVDLTALTHAVAQAVDGTGLMVVGIAIQADSANADDVDVLAGALTPYEVLGEAFAIKLAPGSTLIYDGIGPAISASAKHIDVDGGEGDLANFMILLGDNS